MRIEWASEILATYAQMVISEGGFALLAAVIGSVAWVAVRRARASGASDAALTSFGTVLVLAALAAGLRVAVDHASVYDDAYISFRYADNLLSGEGLVWNPGERVEGYTNFLWLMLVAGLSRITGMELPLVGLFGCLASYVFCVGALAVIERRLMGAELPLAAALFALQDTVTDYATTGLETAFAAGCMLMGVRALVEDRPQPLVVGGWFILTTFCRPDHGVFWAVGGLALLLHQRARSGPVVRPALLYAASFLPYAVYLGWKLVYYGQLLPNTYYAKSADQFYVEQGLIYALTWLVGSHLWLMVPFAALGALRPGPGPHHRTFRNFAVGALLLYNLYVLKVGGDFMYGRFYLVTLPLWLLLARSGLRALGESSTWRGALAAAILTSTVGGVRVVQSNHQWYIADESAVYRVAQWFPEVVVDHPNWVVGTNMGRYLQERGLEPTIGTSGIGMVGYYSGLEVLDLLGLTDARVAHQRLKRRGMPGHEKSARKAYIAKRDVRIIRSTQVYPKRWWVRTKLDLGTPARMGLWRFFRYDAEFADLLEERAPEVVFERFESVLDEWLSGDRPRALERLEEDAVFFDEIYFCCNDDPHREALVDAVLERARAAAATEKARSPRSPVAP